jgi:translation initiation factor 1 (eIF-1/SUI1)
LIGKWKDYEDLEISLSMPELIATLGSKRDLEHQKNKFLAAIQGINLDEDNNKGQQEWESMKARVFSGGATSDGNDVLSLQGPKAKKLGFGIGMGLDYEDLTK